MLALWIVEHLDVVKHILPRLGTLIVVDNVVREGTLLAAQSENKHVKGLRGFYARAAADPRVTATAFQTVGNKALRSYG